MQTIISSFLLIFLAEMGDKTQFLALILATKYKLKEVIIGITIGILANHGLAVLLAYFLSSFINIGILKTVAAFMFLIFGLESFIFKLDDDENTDMKSKFGAILTIAVCFFVGELGDKTQITAMSIVFTGKNPLLTLIGTTSAMICVSLFGIFVGKILKGRIPKNIMKKISGICFVYFGIDALRESIPEKFITTNNIIIFNILLIIAFICIYFNNKRLIKKLEN